jgi:hypothetical protein
MREWMRQHPEEQQEQQVGRALWWDKPQDLETQQRYADSRIAQKPYAYDTDH